MIIKEGKRKPKDEKNKIKMIKEKESLRKNPMIMC